jgi:hypothetical protein
LESDDFDPVGGGGVKESGLLDKGAGLGVNEKPPPGDGALISVELEDGGGGAKEDLLAGGGVNFAGAAGAPFVLVGPAFLESNSF